MPPTRSAVRSRLGEFRPGTVLACLLVLMGCATAPEKRFLHYTLNFETPVDLQLQARVEARDAVLRARYGLNPEQTAGACWI